MTNKILTLAGAAAITLGLGACAYDPYYSGNTRSAVSVSYGYGHGYGGSSFSTSFFWSTGDPRWGYDPYVRAYYDFNRRAYYDPYLYGYYPVGYRPPILVGVPHPSGYRQGWCPPPRRVTNVTVTNYRNRQSAYRSTDHRWAQNVRYDPKHRPSSSSPHHSPMHNQNRNTGPGPAMNHHRNHGPSHGPGATQRPNPTMQSRGAPTTNRQAPGAGPQRGGGRESFGSPAQTNRQSPMPPQNQGQMQRGNRSSVPNTNHRGGQPPQRTTAPQTRGGRESAGSPPQRGNSGHQGRSAPSSRPAPSGGPPQSNRQAPSSRPAPPTSRPSPPSGPPAQPSNHGGGQQPHGRGQRGGR